MRCELCFKPIKKNDDYCKLTDYQKGKFFMENNYHNVCYREMIEFKKEKIERYENQIKGMLKMTQPLLQRAMVMGQDG